MHSRQHDASLVSSRRSRDACQTFRAFSGGGGSAGPTGVGSQHPKMDLLYSHQIPAALDRWTYEHWVDREAGGNERPRLRRPPPAVRRVCKARIGIGLCTLAVQSSCNRCSLRGAMLEVERVLACLEPANEQATASTHQGSNPPSPAACFALALGTTPARLKELHLLTFQMGPSSNTTGDGKVPVRSQQDASAGPAVFQTAGHQQGRFPAASNQEHVCSKLDTEEHGSIHSHHKPHGATKLHLLTQPLLPPDSLPTSVSIPESSAALPQLPGASNAQVAAVGNSLALEQRPAQENHSTAAGAQ
ncbi:hypothetical protein HaLaN_13412, partial [Haematococcus lacustris]